jgi:addiction module RelB/DinJ family antitoxin
MNTHTNTKTVLNIKVDKTLKAKAQKVAKDMGLPLGTIMNHYLRELVSRKRVAFSAPLIPNKKFSKYLDEIEEDIKHKRNFVGPFKTAEEMIRYLHS